MAAELCSLPQATVQETSFMGARRDTSTAKSPDVIALLVSLVGLVEGTLESPASGWLADSPERVLIDVELNDCRYMLVRMRPIHSTRAQLSPREQEIVRMVAKGHPNKVIADVLNISSWTVCTHLRRIFAKLGVTSRAAMVAHLIELEVGKEQGVHSRICGDSLYEKSPPGVPSSMGEVSGARR
jgi:DNA-binding CsgD family transcriptional regulator